jgi:hypothetical protein
MKYIFFLLFFILGAWFGNITKTPYETSSLDAKTVASRKQTRAMGISAHDKAGESEKDSPAASQNNKRVGEGLGDTKVSGQSAVILIIKKYFGKDWKIAKAVAKTESHLNCDAVGDNGNSFGLFQIYIPAHPEYANLDLFDCETNIRCAYEIYRERRNFSAWSTWNDGSYLAFM